MYLFFSFFTKKCEFNRAFRHFISLDGKKTLKTILVLKVFLFTFAAKKIK